MDLLMLVFAGGEISNMAKNEDSGSPGWSAALLLQTMDDVARPVAAAAAAATTVPSTRPSVLFSSKDDINDSPLKKLQNQVSRVLKGFSHPAEVKSVTYNPEVLTSQKRQWESFQLHIYLKFLVEKAPSPVDHRPLKEPSRIFESMVFVGGFLRAWYLLDFILIVIFRHFKSCISVESLKVQVHAIEKSPSMSELNEILLGQEHSTKLTCHSYSGYRFELPYIDHTEVLCSSSRRH
ncbi:uncharacterized protein LOC130760433 isoform X1 [Actinidia eriantha]|uniref:uncharacterized protein LOC130760433 isoform X1 n=1 Tax=Actinidia eriantha TaxID=165200 RepID=UPI002587AECF|nr:uncharacterized protein LOC130760433 isoform X1 [Actinidia eriantha]XP_057471721.1 uncharacterized protein LOC130760433 isoform X1 [Actinidia eriantha]XP_057471722.1 uncharacterized protein LOC130760433 isoform X1 [Actinidia eriantha]XP_057471723.1 uncharacterized protein LOC130760433 isoform X1 [Actinidia eriantha]